MICYLVLFYFIYRTQTGPFIFCFIIYSKLIELKANSVFCFLCIVFFSYYLFSNYLLLCKQFKVNTKNCIILKLTNESIVPNWHLLFMWNESNAFLGKKKKMLCVRDYIWINGKKIHARYTNKTAQTIWRALYILL